MALYTSDVTIRDNVIGWSGNTGISVENALPRIKRNEIHDNNTGIRTANNALPRLYGNELVDNAQYGLYNADASATVSGMSFGSRKAPATKTPARAVRVGW